MLKKSHLPSAALLFQDEAGRSIIIRDSKPPAEGGVLFSSDGVKFYELLVTESSEDFVYDGREKGWDRNRVGFETRLKVSDPHRGTNDDIYWFWNRKEDLDEFEMNGVRFIKGQCPSDVDLEPLPAQITLNLLDKNRPLLFQSATGKSILYIKARSWDLLFSPNSTQFFQVRSSGYNGSAQQHGLIIDSPHHGFKMELSKLDDVVVLGGEVLARQRYTYTGRPGCENPDDGLPSINAFGTDFVLNDDARAALSKHGLTVDEVCANKAGNISCSYRANNKVLVIGGEKFTRVPCPSSVEVIRVPEIREPAYLFRLSDGTYLYASYDRYGTIGRFNWTCETIKLFAGPADALVELPIDEARSYTDGSMIIKTAQGTFSPRPFGDDRTATWKGDKLTWLDPSQFQIVETGDRAQLSELTQVGPTISDMQTALAVKKSPKNLTELRDALAYLVEHRVELTDEVHFSLPNGVWGDADPIWTKIQAGSQAVCCCGELRAIMPVKQ